MDNTHYREVNGKEEVMVWLSPRDTVAARVIAEDSFQGDKIGRYALAVG